METYPIDKLMTEYGAERMSEEMAFGHVLQHIKLLHEETETLHGQRRQLREQLVTMEKSVAALRDMFQQLRHRHEQANHENLLTALNLTVHQLKDEVDSLKSCLELADSSKN